MPRPPFSIVEFEEDFNLVCTKWIETNEEGKRMCAWPNLATSEDYYKTVKQLKDADNSWERAEVVRVLAEYETYGLARLKIRDAELHTDINSDGDSGEKRKRKRRPNPRYLSDDEVNQIEAPTKKQKSSKKSNSSSRGVKECMMPKPPVPPVSLTEKQRNNFKGSQNQKETAPTSNSKGSQNQKETAPTSNSTGSKNQNETAPTSKNKQHTKKSGSSKNIKSMLSADADNLNEERNADLNIELNANQNMACSTSTLSKFDENTTTAHSEICEVETELSNTDVAKSTPPDNDNSFSATIDTSQNKVSAEFTESQKTIKRRTGSKEHISLIVSNEREFRNFVVSQLLNSSSAPCHCSSKKNSAENDADVDVDYLNECFEMKDLKNLEENLRDSKFRGKVVRQMSRVGGATTHKVVRAILTRLIHCSLGTQFSWQGGKGKEEFRKLTALNSTLLSAVRRTTHQKVFIARDASNEDIISAIKDWLRQCIGRHKTWLEKMEKKSEVNNNTDSGDDSRDADEETCNDESSGSGDASDGDSIGNKTNEFSNHDDDSEDI